MPSSPVARCGLSQPNRRPRSPDSNSDASDRCLLGFTHGIGGGGGLTDGGAVWLKKVEPHADLMGVDAP